MKLIRRTENRNFLRCLLLTITVCMVASASALAATPIIKGVKNLSDDTAIKVQIQLSGDCAYADFSLADPARLVIDFKDADTSLVPYEKEITDPVLHSIRIGRPTPETVRVVLDLEYLTPYTIEKKASENNVMVILNRKVETRSNKIDVLPGITYEAKTGMTDEGPLAIHIVDLNLNNPEISIFVGIGKDKLGGREKLTDLVKRKGAVLGLNGGYFSMDSGMPVDLLVVRNKVLLLPDRYRGFFGLDNSGEPVFMRPNTEISIKVGSDKLFYVHRLNWKPGKGEMSIFTPEYGETTGTDAGQLEVVVKDDKIAAFSKGNSKIPENGFVLSADSKNKEFIDSLKIGDRAVAVISSYPDIRDVAYGFSAGPILVKDGVLQDKLVEDFTVSSGLVSKRNPRTAVGRTNNNHLLLVVVEGRNTRSVGMTLAELGKLMNSLGTVDAINLDGGGSSEIVIGDKIVNQLPKDEERPLANALLIFHK